MRKLARFMASPDFPRFVLEMILVGVPFWFALILMAEPDTLRSNIVYKVMAAIVPPDMNADHVWATASAICSGFGIVGIFGRGWVNRAISHLGITAWHGTVALSLYMASTWNTGTGTYALLALAATLLMIGDLCAHSDHD